MERLSRGIYLHLSIHNDCPLPPHYYSQVIPFSIHSLSLHLHRYGICITYLTQKVMVRQLIYLYRSIILFEMIINLCFSFTCERTSISSFFCCSSSSSPLISQQASFSCPGVRETAALSTTGNNLFCSQVGSRDTCPQK